MSVPCQPQYSMFRYNSFTFCRRKTFAVVRALYSIGPGAYVVQSMNINYY